MFRLLKPLDVRMIAHDPHADPAALAALGVEAVSLQAVFECSDFVTFNCPLTEATRGIGSAAMIARMQPTAYLVNTSRGPVVDQTALYQELVARRIAGAPIAVFAPKPPPAPAPTLHPPHVITSPPHP